MLTSAMGPGDVIAGTYEVIRRLGAGGMGTVFEAKHVRLPKRVAVKVLTAAPDPEMLARFRLDRRWTLLRRPAAWIASDGG